MQISHASFLLCVYVCVCVFKSLQSCPTLVTPWTVARQAPLSKGLFRQEYWNGLPFPSPGDLPHRRIEAMSLMSPALAGGFFTTSAIWETRIYKGIVRENVWRNRIILHLKYGDGSR